MNFSGEKMVTRYQEVLETVVGILKKEKDHESDGTAIKPSELLDKIGALASDIPSITDKIYGEG
jgi:hypothetical protein